MPSDGNGAWLPRFQHPPVIGWERTEVPILRWNSGFGEVGGPGGYLPNHALFGAACTVPGPLARSRCRPFGGDETPSCHWLLCIGLGVGVVGGGQVGGPSIVAVVALLPCWLEVVIDAS